MDNNVDPKEADDVGHKPDVGAAKDSASLKVVGEAASKGLDNNVDPKEADGVGHKPDVDAAKDSASEEAAAKDSAGKTSEQSGSMTLETAPPSDTVGEVVPGNVLNKNDRASDLDASDEKSNSAASLMSPSKERAFGVSLTLTKVSQQKRDGQYKGQRLLSMQVSACVFLSQLCLFWACSRPFCVQT